MSAPVQQETPVTHMEINNVSMEEEYRLITIFSQEQPVKYVAQLLALCQHVK
jgi:hypothetical protein